MRARTRIALNTTPLLLRLLLGGFFLWLGLGKLLDNNCIVSTDRAAALANMGVLTPLPTTPPPPPTQPPTHQTAPAPVPPAHTRGTYTADDFPGPLRVQRVYILAADIYQAAHPIAEAPAPTGATGATGPTGATAPTGAAPKPILSSTLAQGAWPVYFAWGVAVIELVGGACILLGLLTRMWAVGVALVEVGAIWLHHIGPAIQSGHATLGFLPDFPPYDPAPWRPLIMHLALFLSALALAFCGPGRASLDRTVFSSPDE